MQRYLTLLIIFTSFIHSYSQDLFDKEHSVKFADYLTHTYQYKYAIQEYERILFLNPDDDSLKWKLFKGFRLAGFYQNGINRFEQLFSDPYSAPTLLAKEYINQLTLNASYGKAIVYTTHYSTFSENKKCYNLTTLYLLSGFWAEAEKRLNSCTDADLSLKEKEVLSGYSDVIKEYKKAKYKNQVLALSMSSVLPGSGKVYAGNWKDGLVSLLIISSSGFQSYRGFSNKGSDSVRGWIYGGIALGFYGGNLYGTYKAVKKRNDNINLFLKKRIEDAYISAI